MLKLAKTTSQQKLFPSDCRRSLSSMRRNDEILPLLYFRVTEPLLYLEALIGRVTISAPVKDVISGSDSMDRVIFGENETSIKLDRR